MSSEMIRRVANAILDSGEGCLSGLAYVDPTKAARAAIEAMRKPTQAMIAAGVAGVADVTVADAAAAAWDAIRFHQAMIDSALSSPAEDMSE
jgi:hypothetical protein